MNLTNGQRVKKLAFNLCRNPDLILPWLRQSLFYKGLPVDLNLPWWSYRAIEAADKIVPGRKIFEYGTGGSTTRYSAVAQSVTSVEDNDKWLELVRDRLSRKGLDAHLIHHPFDFSGDEDFSESSFLKCIDTVDWDMLIIDGQDNDLRHRMTCFRYAEPSARPGSIIIVDDFWRYEDLLQETRAKKVDVFESVGPCRKGVTSTAFFYY